MMLNKILSKIDARITRLSTYRRLAQSDSDLAFIKALPESAYGLALSQLGSSKAQLRQDIFALSMNSFKRSGFFVEFGATNGVSLSNTWLLEKEFGWSGICAEPATMWHEELNENRSCNIDARCVWAQSGEVLTFSETAVGELSTIKSFSNSDNHNRARQKHYDYDVETISLMHLLDHYNAPKVIDYLSIDTEGSEFEILNAFDFSEYQFKCITCEHNHTANRDKILALLTNHGYVRVMEFQSKFDDWYVHENNIGEVWK